MSDNGNLVQSAFSRPWLIKGGALPSGSIEQVDCAKALDPSWPQGDVTKVECPSTEEYGQFEEAAEIQGAQDRVTTGIMARYGFSASTLLKMVRQRCPFDFQVLLGECTEPGSYGPDGWEKILVFPKSRFTEYGIENLGAIESGEANPTNQNVPISAREMYEIVPITFAELAASTVAREIVSIDVCDSVDCGGDCGPDSDGCQVVFAVELGTGATPGTKPRLLYSKNGGSTWSTVDINSFFSNETPTDAACVGNRYVVLNETGNSIHYARSADITSGVAAPFTETITGFVATKTPQAIWSKNSRNTWIVGLGGYVYFMSDPTVGVVVQDAGEATVQDLRDVHAFDIRHAVAVGALNAIIKTTNGSDWFAVTGPVPGVGINTVWMHSRLVWEIGTANGGLYWTEDGGVTWNSVTLPGAPDAIDDIRYSTPSVGYITGRVAGAAKMWRSTAGGVPESWYMLPEASGNSIPDADRLNKIATCDDPNIVFAAGLGGNASDGIILKVS